MREGDSSDDKVSKERGVFQAVPGGLTPSMAYGSFSKIVDISVLKIKKFYIAILRHLLLDYINQSMTYV